MIKSGDRVEALEEKRTWNDKRVLVRKGQRGTAFDSEFLGDIRVTFDGHNKNTWYKIKDLKLVQDIIKEGDFGADCENCECLVCMRNDVGFCTNCSKCNGRKGYDKWKMDCEECEECKNPEEAI